MLPELTAATTGEPWAVNRLIFGLHDARDEEDRPLNERRAPAFARQGVKSELRACPYHDERKGIVMNVTALAQTTRHLQPVEEELLTFRAMVPETPGWDPMLLTVLDALAAPGLAFLADPALSRVSARTAVAYKVAAGFFGALHRVVQTAPRRSIEATPDGFLSFVREQRLLIGGSEACAGPPGMIRKLTEMLMSPPSASVPPDQPRVATAERLLQQLRLGVAWGLYDQLSQRSFFLEWGVADRLRPVNAFMQNKLAASQEAGAHDDVRLQHVLRALPTNLPSALLEPIRVAVLGAGLGASLKHDAVGKLVQLLALREGALLLGRSEHERAFACRFVDHVVAYRAFARAFWAIELQLRRRFGRGVDAPLSLHGSLFGAAHALDWFSAVLGHRLASPPEATGPLVLKNHRRTAVIGELDSVPREPVVEELQPAP